ncbi:MAG: alpha/beta hydrolase [Gammaproteobacteria bacterium]|nr:alpha/beta hydrolase [Gammaproteobacteria bacterium]
MQSRYLTANDGYQIEVFTWPNDEAKAWVHILHGMAEHASRYDEFAQALVAAGYAVIAHNHRGHGNSPSAQIGLYAENDGWNKVLEDIDVVRNSIEGHLPYIMFAHSMGTFITQAYLITQPKAIQGLILSGSNIQPLPLLKAGKMVAHLERWRKGALATSPLLQFLSFGSFNNAFKPNRTDFDWLSRDNKQVDKYIADPLCGFDCNVQLWIDLFNGLIAVYGKGAIERIQQDLPILIFGGDKDPVGEMGKGLPKLAKRYQQAGQANVELKLYENGRHEMLNETNKQDVINDVIQWLNKQ